MSEALFPGVKGPQPETDHLLHLVPRVQMSSVTRLLVWLCSWSAQGQLYLI